MSLKKYDFNKIRLELIKETKIKIAESVDADNFITQSIGAISEIDKVSNILSKRLKEWFELYNPEVAHNVNYEDLVELVTSENKKGVMGGDLQEEDLSIIKDLATKIFALMEEKELLTTYIEAKMKKRCPNVLNITGALIGAKLLAHKGTLKELAFMPASTIQMLGAEKALFRHIKTNARSPKYGYILQHPEVSKAQNKGKAARQLANKISLAAKKDYFVKEVAKK